MSQSTSSSTKVKLTGKEYSWDDVSHLNETQKAHRRGDIDVYAPIRHQKGDPLPSIAEQWKEDYRKRHVKSTRNR